MNSELRTRLARDRQAISESLRVALSPLYSVVARLQTLTEEVSSGGGVPLLSAMEATAGNDVKHETLCDDAVCAVGSGRSRASSVHNLPDDTPVWHIGDDDDDDRESTSGLHELENLLE